MIGKSNTFYYNKLGDNWFIEVTINSSNSLDFYIVEASLSGKNTKYTNAQIIFFDNKFNRLC
jgi:subtilase family serine protease